MKKHKFESLEKLSPEIESFLDRAEILSETQEREEIRKAQNGDKQALDRLCSSMMKAVVKLAYKHFRTKKHELMDLVSAGLLGLTEAINRFDLRQDVKLHTYATWWIEKEIKDEKYALSRLVRISRDTMLEAWELMKQEVDPESQKGAVKDAMKSISQGVSSIQSERFESQFDLEDSSHSFIRGIERSEEAQELLSYVDNDRDREIVFRCVCLGMSQRVVAKKFKLSPQGISLIVLKSLEKIERQHRYRTESRRLQVV